MRVSERGKHFKGDLKTRSNLPGRTHLERRVAAKALWAKAQVCDSDLSRQVTEAVLEERPWAPHPTPSHLREWRGHHAKPPSHRGTETTHTLPQPKHRKEGRHRLS